MKKLFILEIWCGQNVNLLFVIFFILFDDFMPLKFGDFWRFVHSPGDERDTQNISLNWSIPHICPFWYSATWFRPVNSTPKSAQIRNKIALIGQNGSTCCVLYAKKYTSSKKVHHHQLWLIWAVSWSCSMFRDKTQKTDVNKRCAKNRCKYVGDVPKAGVSERFARPASNSNPYKNFKASQ